MSTTKDKTRHTPGPWSLSEDGFVYGDKMPLCDPHCDGGPDPDEREANARLIAAAPAMYEALRGLPEHCDGEPSVDFAARLGAWVLNNHEKVCAALTAADGRERH